jgi:hypothetical protein
MNQFSSIQNIRYNQLDKCTIPFQNRDLPTEISYLKVISMTTSMFSKIL